MARKQPKKDITLMTILAYESTNESRKLLNKYGRPDAQNISDLEKKLADLYFSTDDKVQLEKDMAEIHPHKNWILKTLKTEEEKAPVVEEVKAPVIDGTKECQTCCPSCSANKNSNFYGDIDEPRKKSKEPSIHEAMIGPVMVLAIFSLAAIAVVKANK